MRQIVEAHRARGHTLVLSSSALTIHAEPVARALGIADVVCNTFELDSSGLLTGRINRPVVWGRQKAVAVQRFCADRGVALRNSYFYADGDEDSSLMELVGHPRPVNPRQGLATLAATRGWPVLQVAVPGQRVGAADALGHLPGLGRAALRRRSVRWLCADGTDDGPGRTTRRPGSDRPVRDVGDQTAVDHVLRTGRE